jgi:hypothetical protein
MNKSISCTIKGISPLLMHSFPLVKTEAIEKMSPEEQAEIAAYRNPTNGLLYIPGVNVQRAFIASAAYSKGKGRASLQKPVAACVMISPDRLDLGVEDYEIDARPVVIPATKGRVVRFRPRLDEWSIKFEIEYDPTLLTEGDVRKVVDDAGSRVGLLDFRPAKNGPFGRFIVTEWK